MLPRVQPIAPTWRKEPFDHPEWVFDFKYDGFRGPPATLGSTAAAHLRLIVWCKDCRHQVEPDPAEMAERYGPEATLLDCSKRLVCSQCGSHNIDMVVSGAKR